MSVINNSLLLTAPAAGAGYQVQRSIRLNSADSASLSRTPSVAGNRKTWTWAGWVKKTGTSSGNIFAASPDNWAGQYFYAIFSGGGVLQLQHANSVLATVTTIALYRDPGAWFHLVIAFDTTQATAANRILVYVNGVQAAFTGTASYPNLNEDTLVNSTCLHRISGRASGDFNGYLAECYLIDGQALTPSSFTETDATTGQLIPKAYTGSYGTNGFKLNFSDNSTAAALGTDTSGNGNTWTVNNLTVGTGGPTSVAASTGGLPIWNTADTYGQTINTGLRADGNAGFLVLAAPLTTSGSNSLSDDESPSGRTASTKTLSATGTITSSSSTVKFYGTSASFGSNSYYSLNSADFNFGTSDFTIEFWVYPSGASSGSLVSTNLASLSIATFNSRLYHSTGTLDVYTNGGAEYISLASAVPVNAWSHVAFCRSGAQTLRVFVNGVLKTTNNAWGVSYSDSGNLYINNGRDGSTTRNFQDFRIYKGVAKYTSNFNPPTATQDATIAAVNDSLVDTPTSYGTDTGAGGEVRGNYATLNPLHSYVSLASNGNLDCNSNGSGWIGSTIHVTTGKWYVEFTVGTTGTIQMFGVCTSTHSGSGYPWQASTPGVTYYVADGRIYVDGVNTGTTTSATSGDIISLSFDVDAKSVVVRKNNTVLSTKTIGTTSSYMFYISDGGGNATSTINFGQRAFAYPLSGFKALCDTNLPTPVIAKPNTVMDVALWTGNGSARSITGLAFNPDFVWIKGRSGATDHALYDAVRGVQIDLVSNSTAAETTQTQGLTAFNSDGFSLGTLAKVNTSSATYAGWAWDAGTSTVTNTAGSISSQVRANASAGFSVVTYTGNGAVATIGHGLNVAPSMVIVKRRNGAADWPVWHKSLTSISSNHAIILNTSDAAASYAGYFNGTSPTSTVFTIYPSTAAGSNGFTYVAYCFAPVAGYSSFGSYTGNGSADGPFVYTGFKPRFVLCKLSSAAGADWLIFDTARSPYNVVQANLRPNTSGAEESALARIDILSNGFKVRAGSGVEPNGTNGNTYIYAAWAEFPFQYSRAA